jgi:rod shape-determining protein MreC
MKSRIKQRSVSYSASLSVLNGRSGSMIFITLAVLFLFMTFVRPNILSGARMSVVDVFSPVLSAVSRPFQDMAAAVSSISGRAALKAENVKLKTENARLREWYQTALMLQAENQSLQKLLNLKVSSEHQYTTARVISDGGNAFVKTLLVASGQKEGIQKDQAVLAGEGMIGRIIEAGQNASRILLVTDINSRIPVIIQGTNQKAILAGSNGAYPSLQHLPKDTGLLEGARIVTSGDGGIFPYGLPVGVVMLGGTGNVFVKPYADMERITYVRVVDTVSNPNLIKNEFSSFSR